MMKPSMRETITFFLLAVYVPLSLLLGFLHTDEVPATGSGKTSVQSVVLKGTAQSENDGYCLACLFATGHVLQSQTLISGPAFRHIPLVCFISPSFSTPSQPQSARAPPVPSVS
jgi:hypothetical protein